MGRVITNPTGSVVDASEVKILYESNENTNAYTDGDKASLGEVKDAIDMAKKVIEITFLLNDWTSNSDGTYSQTVNNSEIKSSMNPDLISMLSSGATPEEQKTYMKNFSILCQGVGNTANGSVTYKIYKQMTGDITVGLTRLGGVKQIESGGLVDDVKVGGISVVKDKVAEIPEIPTSISVGASIKKSGEFFPSDEKNVELKPDGMVFTGSTPNSSSITVTPEYSKDEDFDHLAFIVKNYKLQQGFAKLKVGEPTKDSHATTKKYVDESISAIPEVDVSNLVPYSGATKDVNIGNHSLVVATTKQDVYPNKTDSYSLTANIGIGVLETPGTSIEVKKDEQYPDADSPYTEKTNMTISPGSFSVLNRRDTSDGIRTDMRIEATTNGFEVSSNDNAVLITDTAVKQLADPVDGKDAANKKYVDESIAAIPEVDTSDLVPYTGAIKNLDLGKHRLEANCVTISDGASYISVGSNSVSTTENNINFTRTDGEFAQLSIGDPTSDSHAATKKYVDLVSGNILSLEIPSVSVPKGGSMTNKALIPFPESPRSGYHPMAFSIVIYDEYESLDTMYYNYGINKYNEVFVTYFNNNQKIAKESSRKRAVIHYAYVKSEE